MRTGKLAACAENFLRSKIADGIPIQNFAPTPKIRNTTSLKENDDTQVIIQRALSGNQIAFSTLLDTFWNVVYGFQLKRTENENDAEDITIQTFSKAFDKLRTYDSSYEFGTWLIAISKNIHVDLIRKRKRNLETDGNADAVKKVLDDAPSAEDRLINEQNLSELLRHIKKLKPHYREVINLRYFKELSYADIAKELNEPMNNVKVKLLRAKKLLAEIISGGKP